MNFLLRPPTTLNEWAIDACIGLGWAALIGTYWRLGTVIELLRQILAQLAARHSD